jgi:hypothetical protein
VSRLSYLAFGGYQAVLTGGQVGGPIHYFAIGLPVALGRAFFGQGSTPHGSKFLYVVLFCMQVLWFIYVFMFVALNFKVMMLVGLKVTLVFKSCKCLDVQIMFV